MPTHAEAHQATFKGVVKHPAKWTKAEVTDWFNTACNGAFKRAGALRSWPMLALESLSTLP